MLGMLAVISEKQTQFSRKLRKKSVASRDGVRRL